MIEALDDSDMKIETRASITGARRAQLRKLVSEAKRKRVSGAEGWSAASGAAPESTLEV